MSGRRMAQPTRKPGTAGALAAGVSGHRKHLVEHSGANSAVSNFGLPSVMGAAPADAQSARDHPQPPSQQQQQLQQQAEAAAALSAHTKTYTVPMRVPIHTVAPHSPTGSGALSAHAAPASHGAAGAAGAVPGAASTMPLPGAVRHSVGSASALAAAAALGGTAPLHGANVWGAPADSVYAPTVRTLRTPAALSYVAERSAASERVVTSPLKNFLNYTHQTSAAMAIAAAGGAGQSSLLQQVLASAQAGTNPSAAAAAILANAYGQPQAQGAAAAQALAQQQQAAAASSSAAAAAAAAANGGGVGGPAGMKVHKQIGALSSFAGVVVVDLEREKEQEKEREWAEAARAEELRQQKEEAKRKERDALEARRRYAKMHPIYQPPEAVRHHREQLAARLDALKRSQPKLPSQIVKIDLQRRHSLLAALQRRPDQSVLKKKRILRGLHEDGTEEEPHSAETGSMESRTSKIDAFLKSRPTSEQLKTRNIIQTGPSTVDRAKSLTGLLQRRAGEQELKNRQILREANADEEKETKSNKSRAVLQKMLQDRPGYNKLIQQHVAAPGADTSVHAADAAAAAQGPLSPHSRQRDSFASRQEQLKTLLDKRPKREGEDEKSAAAAAPSSPPRVPHKPLGVQSPTGSVNAAGRKLVPSPGGTSGTHASPSHGHGHGHGHGHAHGQGHGHRHHNEPAEPGGLYMWGRGTEAQLGLGAEQDRLAPVFLDVLRREVVVQVSCGLAHTVLRTENGNAYVFGQNSYGQLCLGDRQRRLQPFSPKYRKSPLYRKSIIWVTAGDRTTGFITDEHEVYVGGFAGDGALGIGPTAKDQVELLPVLVAELTREKKIDKLALGSDHACALTEMGDLYTWGRGGRGQLGHDDRKDYFSPKLLKQFTGVFVDVACGDQFNAALASGKLFTWGANTKGQCGLGTDVDVAAPKQVTAAFKAPVQKVVCGRSHIVALTEDGNVYSTLHKPDTALELEHEKEKQHEGELLAEAEKKAGKKAAAAAAAAAAGTGAGDEEDEKIGTFVHLKPRAIFHDISAGLDTVGLSMSGVIYFWNTRNGQTIEKLSTLEGLPTQAIAAGDLHYACIAALPHGVRRTAEETAQAVAGHHGQNAAHPHPHPHGHGHGTDQSSARKGSLPGGAGAGGASARNSGSSAMGPGPGAVTGGGGASSAAASGKRHSSLDLTGTTEVRTLAELGAALAAVSRKQKTPEPKQPLTEAEKIKMASKRRGSQPAALGDRPAVVLSARGPAPTGSTSSLAAAAGGSATARRGSRDSDLTPAQRAALMAQPLVPSGSASNVGGAARRGSKQNSRTGSRRNSLSGEDAATK